jgi:hypothetical protein
MKFCYIDESGTDAKPYAVMAGIIADTYGMHITKKDWAWLLNELSKIIKKPISEIHTADFYAGNGVWRTLDGEIRARIISAIFNWLKLRKLKVVYASVDKSKYENNFMKEPYAKEINTLWCFMALHICLALQKCHQSFEENKGNTVLIFDKEETEADKLIKLIKNPPEWTDTYYRCLNKNGRFNQIIDVPYFGDSKHVGLIQVADFVSFFLRRNIEIKMGIKSKYEDEQKRIEEWANIALKQSIPKSAIYMSKGRCPCAELFYRYAPPCLLK